MQNKFMGGIIIGKLKILKKPFKNKKALGMQDVIIMTLVFTMVVTLVTMFSMGLYHFSAEAVLNSKAQQFTNIVSESGKLDVATQNYFKSELNKSKKLYGDYEIKYIKYDSKRNFSRSIIGTSDNGSTVGDHTLARNDSFKIVIKSKKKSAFSGLLSMFGDTFDIRYIGHAEARVE